MVKCTGHTHGREQGLSSIKSNSGHCTLYDKSELAKRGRQAPDHIARWRKICPSSRPWHHQPAHCKIVRTWTMKGTLPRIWLRALLEPNKSIPEFEKTLNVCFPCQHGRYCILLSKRKEILYPNVIPILPYHVTRRVQ